jgi:hypothetical protein
MNFSCEQIGLTEEELQTRIIDGIVTRMLEQHILYTEDSGEFEDIGDTPMRHRLDKAIKSHIDAEVDRVATNYLEPMVKNLIEGHTLQMTNEWGEKRGDPITFTEYLVKRAADYMAEPVDHNGKPKGRDSYSWKQDSTRLVYAVKGYLQIHMEQAMKQTMGESNKIMHDAIMGAVNKGLSEVMKQVKVNVSVK